MIGGVSAPDVAEIRTIAEGLDPAFATAVRRWDVEVREDSSGQPAVFVVIVLKDEAIRSVWKSRNAYRERLFDRLLALAPDYFPFIRFDAESEALDPAQPART